MKCKLILLFTALLLVSVLTVSCGGDNGGTTADTSAPTVAEKTVQEIASQILANGTFSEQLSENGGYLDSLLPNITCAESIAYVPAGITPEEIFVFRLADGGNANDVVTALGAYRDRQIADYGDYAPQQVPKLNDTVILTSGNTVVYAVFADGENAESIVRQALGLS